MMPASIQICPIEIPGRGRRSNKQAVDKVDELADLLVHGLPLQVQRSLLSMYMSSLGTTGISERTNLFVMCRIWLSG